MDISSEHIINSFDSSSLYGLSKKVRKKDSISIVTPKTVDPQISAEKSKKRVENTDKQRENQVDNMALRDLELVNSNKNQEESVISDDSAKTKNDDLKDKSRTVELSNNTFLQFELEEKVDKVTNVKTKELVVYLRDKETGEVIRRVPPEEYVDLYKNKLNIQNRGMFVDRAS